jgi:hypothetical protein
VFRERGSVLCLYCVYLIYNYSTYGLLSCNGLFALLCNSVLFVVLCSSFLLLFIILVTLFIVLVTVYCSFIVLSKLRVFRAFSSVVRQIPEYNSQRRGKFSFLCIMCTVCV